MEEEKDHENLSLRLLDALDKSEEHAVAMGRGVLRRTHSSVNNRLLSRMLLGIFIIAQQFSIASAQGICHSLDKVREKLDLIGLISAFGTVAATKGLSYSTLNDNSFYVTGHIGPGSLNVAATLFQATGFRLAKLMVTLGGMGNAHEIAQLDCPYGLHYIGLKSNSECPVGNKVGANIVREHQLLWQGNMKLATLSQDGSNGGNVEMNVGRKVFGRVKGRDSNREVKVFILEIELGRKEEVRVLLKASKGGAFFLGWLPLLLTVGVMVGLCISCKQWFVAGLIALGTLGMMVAVVGLRLCLFKHTKPRVADGAPRGDCLVIDDNDVDTFHIILGQEYMIQSVFQRKIDCQLSTVCKYVLFLAGSLLGVYVVASVLYLPNVSLSGQLLFVIANLIGFVTDMVKATKNGNLGLAKKACEEFRIEARDMIVFRNRIAAVAFVAKHADDCTMLRSKRLLPCEGFVWQKWWQELAQRTGKANDTGNHIDAAAEEPMDGPDIELLKTLLQDMTDGLKA